MIDVSRRVAPDDATTTSMNRNNVLFATTGWLRHFSVSVAVLRCLVTSKFCNRDSSLMKTRRPLAITVLCILIFAGALSVLIRDIPRGHFAASWIPFYLACSSVITIVCAVGMWKMKKWSVYTYACWAALGSVVGITMLGMFNLNALIVRLVIVIFSFYCICVRYGRHAEPEKCT